MIRVRNLPTRCTEEIEDFVSCYESEHTVNVGRTYVEGTAEELLDVAQQLRDKEIWFDFKGTSEAFYEQCMKNAEAARVRWATKIEKTANSHPTMAERTERILRRRATIDLVEGCP